MSKKIVVGIDFDGVIAYNPFRIIRLPISIFKRKFFKIKKLTFFSPHNEFERFIWTLIHESSIFPAKGVDLLKQLVEENKIEIHLVTARYHFLDKQLVRWLKNNQLYSLFTSINLNTQDEQPHLFKQRIIEKNKFDYYIEDNLDIVKHLNATTHVKVLWIYNILDRDYSYANKYPNLQQALEKIVE